MPATVLTTPRRVLLLLGLLACLSACAPARREPIMPAIDPATIPQKEFGRLAVFITSQGTDGRNIQLRGLVANPYTAQIEGVRMVFRILTAPDRSAHELDRFQKILHLALAPGDHGAFSWDLQTMYAGQAGTSGIELEAFAITRGGQTLPLPPDWKE